MKVRTQVLFLGITLLCLQGNVNAGSVAGFGGSTEVTQILNNLQLIQSYEQQVQAYVRQGVQVQNELRNLIANPTSVLGSDVGNMINTIGQIWNGGQSMGFNLAQIDRNFAQTYKSPTLVISPNCSPLGTKPIRTRFNPPFAQSGPSVTSMHRARRP